MSYITMNPAIIFTAKYLIFVLLLAAIFFVIKKNKEDQRKIFLFALMTLPATYVVAKIASFLYYDPRPFVIGNFVPLISHIADNGFPSDHTLLSSAAAAVIYYFDKKFGAVLFVLALLVGGARVLAGVHHMVDVVGSFAIAILVASFVHKFVLPRVLKSKIFQEFQK